MVYLPWKCFGSMHQGKIKLGIPLTLLYIPHKEGTQMDLCTEAISTPHSYANATGAAFSSVQADAQVWPAVLAEAVMTLFLTMVVCMGAVNSQTRGLLAPLCIGLTVVANILAGGAVSGACMNPARAFGPAVVANVWGYHWIYWVGPMAGALLTVGFVRLLLGDRAIRVLLK